MKRRAFVKSAGTAMSLPLLLNGMELSAMGKTSIFEFSDPDNDHILVLIQLNGGTDGLNMILPRDQYDPLMEVRGNILLPENKILELNDLTGIHPAMQGAQDLFNEGKLAVIQSVGYPNQNRSHFRSLDIWQTASSAEEYLTSGWLGRHFDYKHPDYPENYPNAANPHPFAISMGRVVSETCEGSQTNFSITLEDPFQLIDLFEGQDASVPNTPYGDELAFLRISKAQTNAYSEKIVEAANKGANTVSYPDNTFSRQLANIALLISGGMQTKVYVVSLGGFDTHANQVEEFDTTKGTHANLLQVLSEGMLAFQQDLANHGLEERVIGMTFSEFGRRIKSNDSMGTDHGTAVPLMLFGSCVNNQVLGENPEIDPKLDPSEGLPMQFDFRDVYGSLLKDWFGVDETIVRELIHRDFQALPLVKSCNISTPVTTLQPETPATLDLYPNPCQQWLYLSVDLPTGKGVRISLLNSMGALIRIVSNRELNSGNHQIPVEMGSLPSGIYFIRMQQGQQVITRRVIKLR